MSSIKERITKKCHSDPRVTIDTIHTNIISDLNEEEKKEYYLENGLLLDQYYSKTGENKSIKTKDNTSVLSYFQKNDTIEETGINSISDKLTGKSIIDFYMSNIDDTYVLHNEIYMNDKCKLCNNNMSFGLIDSELVCEKCGYTEDIIINSEKCSYKDPPREVSYFAYKRINHFNEWLAQFQAKESTEISDNIYKNIFDEIHKNVNLDIQKIKPKQMKSILKKMGYNKYYEHIPHIINVMSGKKAPCLSRKEEEQLRTLFKEIQIPFSNNCPPNRKNFLSYSYVLHKFCELLEYDYLLPYFPLLKSREKLLQQDQIWKLICNDLCWQFIESI
uniref:Late transcription factor VLTF3-like protein n=1 Tax=viral metagenome TaxID=1070528 RepID=A0A6C0CDD6_9ZZZZ